MSDYIDYVYCQKVDDDQTKHLFKTKAGSELKAGDIVLVEGWRTAGFYVLAVSTTKKGSDFDFFIRTMYEYEEVMWE